MSAGIVFGAGPKDSRAKASRRATIDRLVDAINARVQSRNKDT